MPLTPSQQKAYSVIMAGYNVFLTGHAGTGKSFLLRKAISDLESRGKRVVVAAPTGIAAISVGGTTLHRLFGLRPDIYTNKAAQVPSVLYQTDVLFIDEISMCRIDLFDYIGRVLQKSRRPIQVVVVGDFCQLPPVMPRKTGAGISEKEILDLHFGFDVGGAYAFLSPQWERIIFKTMELTEVIRQDDPAFIYALDEARLRHAESLPYFVHHAARAAIPGGIYLAGRNAEVDRLNAKRLAAIDAPSYFYEARTEGDVSAEDRRVAPEVLELKVGARVMMTTNDELDAFYNGSLGYVSYLSEDKICVAIDDGEECEISRNAWDVVRYTVDGEGSDATFKRTVAGRYIQYPIKLAWAVTIHKSQGQTFSKVNLNPNCWDSGQLYVALSRVKSINGLHLTAPIYNRYLTLDPAVEEFYNRTQEPDDAGIASGMDYKKEPVKKKAALAEDGPEQIGLFWSMQQEGPT